MKLELHHGLHGNSAAQVYIQRGGGFPRLPEGCKKSIILGVNTHSNRNRKKLSAYSSSMLLNARLTTARYCLGTLQLCRDALHIHYRIQRYLGRSEYSYSSIQQPGSKTLGEAKPNIVNIYPYPAVRIRALTNQKEIETSELGEQLPGFLYCA
jgi:hypothetical protein